ncbi:MAG TPA: hypothetical protein VHV57_10250 [Acidimicrobiales bacterium]|jgi:hypothetical protein|nr:hypothetical protein [Acidimicrobiales bacterium]
MDMSGPNSVWVVPSEHIPGLVALVATPLFLWLAYCALQGLRTRHVAWAETTARRLSELSGRAKVVLFGLWIGFVVHVAIIPTHWKDAHGTALLFCLDAVVFAAVGVWTFLARPHWKLASVAILGGTAGFYALYLLAGWETADPVGLVTTTLELAAALVLLVPVSAAVPGFRTRDAWTTVAAVPVALITLVGVAALGGSATGDAAPPPSTPSSASRASSSAMPGMSMGSTGGKTKGAGASSAAAFSLPTTSPAGAISWPYSMGTMEAGMKMVDASCTARPSANQQQAAVSLVDQTTAAMAPYRSLAAAKAAGYVPLTPTGQRQVHYINPTIFGEQGDGVDPNAVPVLVYDNTNRGAVLVAAMYLMSVGASTPPQPGGCLTQWHVHTNLCLAGLKVVGTDTAGACANGVNAVTPPMMHVWLVPDGSGPLDPEPSNLAVLQGARTLVPSPQNATA